MRISDWSSDVCSSDLAVGEVNGVTKMKEVDAVIGGEGNGCVIYPEVHYGRDALIGIALFLSHLAKSGKRISELRASYPPYYMSKNKITLTPGLDIDGLLATMQIGRAPGRDSVRLYV